MIKLLHFLFAILMVAPSLAQTTSSSVRSDGTILLNGQPFFPFGSYNTITSYDDPLSTRLEDLQAQIDAGFNLSHISAQPLAHREALMDLADQNDFYLYVLEPNPSNMPLTAPWIKDRKSLFAYEVADDADNGVHTIAELANYTNQVDQIDPNRIKYLTLTAYTEARQNQAGDFAAICDAIALQAYPITPLDDYYNTDDSRALIENYKTTVKYVDAANAQTPKRPMIYTAQASIWSQDFGGWTNTHPNPRYPSVAEARNMFYSGIAAGAKGIDVYCYSRDLQNTHTGLWNEILDIREDVSEIENALMDGAYTRVNTNDEELTASYWIYNGACYMVVINHSYTNTKQVSIPLPNGYAGQIDQLDSRFTNSMSISGQNLFGSLAPTDVQVYVIQAGSTPQKYSDVTFRVKLPAGAPGPAYIVGQSSPLQWAFNPSTKMALVPGTSDTYTKTLSLPAGAEFGYRYAKGYGWTQEESTQLDGCGELWGNARRLVAPGENTVLSMVNWGECPSPMGATSSITFKVDMGSNNVSNGVYLYGNWNTNAQGNRSPIAMYDESPSNNIYSVTVALPEGETVDYRYGLGTDGSLLEGVALSCANANGERSVTVGSNDHTVGFHWGTCLDYTEARTSQSVTFFVDVSGTGYQGAQQMYIFGNMTNQQFVAMKPYFGSNTIFSYTTTVYAGDYGQFFFLGSNNWNQPEPDHTSCSVWSNNDRYYEITPSTQQVGYKWGTCNSAYLPTGTKITFQVTLPQGATGPAYIVGEAPLQWAFNSRTKMDLKAGTARTYTITRLFQPGQSVGYRFTKGSGWQHEESSQLNGCGQIWGNARLLNVGNADQVLSVVNWGQCPSSSSRRIDDTLEASNDKVVVYPNPGSGILHIKGEVIDKSAVLYHISGIQYELPIVENKIDVSRLKAGTYLLKVNEEFLRIQLD